MLQLCCQKLLLLMTIKDDSFQSVLQGTMF